MKLVNHLLSYLPTSLPVGLTEFNLWADSIIELAGHFADRDSMVYALASMVQHSGHTEAFVPKRRFVKALRKAAANQIAAQVFLDIKERNQVPVRSDKVANPAEETAQKESAPSDATDSSQKA